MKSVPIQFGPVAMRWFDGLRTGSINSFKELIQAFGSRFLMCTKVPRPLDSLLSLSMRERETLKTYSDRYWEIYNEIKGNFEDVAISTLKSGLPAKHGLRKSLIGNQSPACANLCTVLTSIKGLRKINNWVKERLRLSLRRGGISGQTDSITTDPGEILLDNLGLPTPRSLMQYSKNQCTKF